MAKRKVRLQIRKTRRLAARSNVKNKEYAKKLDKNREIIKKDNIQVEVTLSRSVIGKLPSKVRTVVALGLKRIGDMKKHTLNEAIRGMLNRIINMIDIKEVK